jgi:pilus assembly protein CpaE
MKTLIGAALRTLMFSRGGADHYLKPFMPIIDARYYKTLLICPSKPMVAELTPILAHGLPLAPVQAVNAYLNRRQLVDLLKTFEASICFLDVATSRKDAFDVIADLHALLPEVPVIAVLANNDPDVVLQCLRQGAADFLIRPFTTDQIDACVEKIARILPPPGQRAVTGAGKVISVVPAKGAAGATTVACNLAFQCKRLGAKKTLLADMDPLTGTIPFILKLKSTYSFLDVLQRQSTLDSDLWKQMVTVSNGVEVLLPPESFVDPIADLPSAAPIIDYAQCTYEAVVLDCGNAFGTWNLSMAQLADEVLLVTSTDLPSLQAAQRVLTYFEQNRVEISKVKLVVNRSAKDIGLNAENMAKAFKGEIFQTLPNDTEAVQKSLMDGKPIPANTAIGKNFSSMADRLMNLKNRDTAKASAKQGLFSSIFSR